MDVKLYDITKESQTFLCKATTFMGNIMIGVGSRRQMCVTLAIKKNNPTSAYIDRVEYNDACFTSGSLEDSAKNNTIEDIVNSALYFVKSRYPEVTTFTLKDDSHIYCQKGSRMAKLSLAFDYLIKYNETWYQNKFHATLPPPYLEIFQESLKALDAELDPFEFQAARLSYLTEYEAAYRESSSPRDFIQRLRKTFGAQYCFKVGQWLQKYMELLKIQLFSDNWIIPVGDLNGIGGFHIEESSVKGGCRKSYRNKKKTRKIRQQQQQCPVNFSIVVGGSYAEDDPVGVVGYYV